jgi:tripartite-type tricarboxylate transporter receptor subunit TctC
MSAPRLLTALALATSLVLPVSSVRAQTDTAWPAKPIHLVVPFPPGGSVDTVARLLAPRLAAELGQSVVVENRGGASGNIGTEGVVRATPDGYTLLVHTIPLVANPFLYARVPYDLMTDLVPVTMISAAPTVVAIHPGVAAQSVRELITLARARPGTLNFATAGAATNPHIAAELFNDMAGINTVAVHFKGGGPGLLATLSGDTQIVFAGISEAAPHMPTGKLRVLAITSARRSPGYPDLPTVSESGLPGYEFVTWHGLLAPRGTSPAVVNLLAERVRRALANPELARLFMQNGIDVVGNTPAEFAQRLRDESAKWGRVIKSRGMRMD